jgi:GNAT superfamily N-acetyltransferase
VSEEALLVREPHPAEQARVEEHLRRSWGSTIIVTRGRAHDASRLPTLVATHGEEIVGIATYRLEGGECELLTLDALEKRHGIGSALLGRVGEVAAANGCRRVWLITTNDNLDAIRFYQRRGMRLVAVHSGAIDDARRIKPGISEVGEFGIPIHDELEFELTL